MLSQLSPEAVEETQLDNATLLALFRQMLLLRRFETEVQAQYKRGAMPGFLHLYIGQEAVATGVCAHLRREDWISSTHRGHGHALAKGVAPSVVMAELYGKATGCNGGRGGSMHLYDAQAGLFGTNGFVAGGLPATVGIGIGARVRGTDAIGVAFFGDGATGHGAWHESLNFAAAQNAPVVFVCENNLYATATPLHQATKNTDIASRAAAYGIAGESVDGNDVLAVYQAALRAVQRARRGDGPTLLEARTYRTVGHHEGDTLVGTYRTQKELDEWKTRDPIERLRAHLLQEARVLASEFEAIEADVNEEVREATRFALASPFPDAQSANDFVWAQPFYQPQNAREYSQGESREQDWLSAVRDGIAEEMRHDPHLIYLGEGIGERGGSFGHTKGLWAEFGGARVIDTPICELGFTGAAMGAAATGCRAVADLMFSDFLFEATTQLVEQAAKLRYMTNNRLGVPLVVRSGMGAIKNAGPHHSGTYYPMWAHCPGLLVAVPSNPADAKGLWKTALRSGDPVLMFEHKSLFASKGQVPQGEGFVPFGQAARVLAGDDITLVSCGLLLHRCLEAAHVLQAENISCEVIDLRTIVPLDVETIAQSLTKTGRLLVVDEAFSMCGVGAEIAAAMMEMAFDELDAPVGRLQTQPVAHPFSPPLENAIVVDVEKIVAAAKSVLHGVAPKQIRAPRVLAKPQKVESAPELVREVARESVSRELEEQLSDVENTTCESYDDRDGNETQIVMPNVDLTISEAQVVAWKKRDGERVEKGEVLLEVESSKAVYDVEAPVSGTLQTEAKAGETVKIGQRLGRVKTAF